MDQFRRVAEEGNCAVELVHHVRKTNGEDVTADSARGASAFHDALRSLRTINRMTPEEARLARVDNPASYFRVDRAKANMQPPAHAAAWFEIKSEGLNNGREGLAGDHIGVVTRFDWPGPLDGLPENALRLAQEALREGKGRLNSQSPDWAGHIIGKVPGIDSRDNLDGGGGFGHAQIREIIKTLIKNGGLVVCAGKDAQGRPRDFVTAGE